MITVNGMEYKTLDQHLYANGRKVLEAYANGNLVYPEREDKNIMKIVGHIDTMVGHSHAGEDPSAESNDGSKYWYESSGVYRAHGCFCLVLHSDSFRPIGYSNNTYTIPSAHWPLTSQGGYEAADIKEGNEWVVFPYEWSTAPLLPQGDGVHPLLGSDAMQTHMISHSGYSRQLMDAELLFYVNVSAPEVCAFRADKMYVGLGAYLDATGTPGKSSLPEVPGDINGLHRLYVRNRDLYFGIGWQYTGGSGRRLRVQFGVSARSKYGSMLGSYLHICTDNGYIVPYTISGTRQGEYVTVETEYTQRFNILNIPVTDMIYYGKEKTAPVEHLHPRIEDIIEYM